MSDLYSGKPISPELAQAWANQMLAEARTMRGKVGEEFDPLEAYCNQVGITSSTNEATGSKEYKFIRIKAYPYQSDQSKLTSLGAFLGQYAHLEGYFEAVATQRSIDLMRQYGFDVFDGMEVSHV